MNKPLSKIMTLAKITFLIFVIQFFVGCDLKSSLSEVQTLINVDRVILETYHQLELSDEAMDNNYYSSSIYLGDAKDFSEQVTEEKEIKKLISDSMFSIFAYWRPTDEEKVKYSEMMYKKIEFNNVKYFKYNKGNSSLHAGAPFDNLRILDLGISGEIGGPSTIMIITSGDVEDSNLYGVFASDIWD